MADSDYAEEPCFICRPLQDHFKGFQISTEIGNMSVPHCRKHDVNELREKFKEALLQRMRSMLPNAGAHGSEGVQQPHTRLPEIHIVRETGALLTRDQQTTTVGKPSPNSASQTKPPYGQPGFVAQNLPPTTSNPSQNGARVSETENDLLLAYAYRQLHIATSALSNAHGMLQDFDKAKLPVRTLKQRMRKLRKLEEEIVIMAARRPSGE